MRKDAQRQHDTLNTYRQAIALVSQHPSSSSEKPDQPDQQHTFSPSDSGKASFGATEEPFVHATYDKASTRTGNPADVRVSTPSPTKHEAPTLPQGARSARNARALPPERQMRHELSADQATSPRARSAHATKSRKPNFITRGVNQWFNRLMGAVSDGTLAGQEEAYESNRTTRDYIWNTIGIGAWGMVFPLLTIIVTQLVGVEQAGMFSLAFVTGTLLMILANYGVRTYQVSDVGEAHSFSDYQINRWITCAFMVLIGVLYCMFRGYAGDMFLISIGVYLYKMIDGLADVYEGRLQQMNKLYLAGISQAFRSVAVFVVFSLCLLITRNIGLSSIAMAIAAIISFVILTFPLTLFETPKSRKWNVSSIVNLFKQCAPLFVALFLYAFIDNMPKFVMEGVLPYDSQLYFNALYFPAQGILLTVGFIYKPLLVRMANVWADPEKRKRFDLIIVAIMVVIVVLTAGVALIMNWFGITVMSFMYGVDFEQFRGLCFIMLAAGGVTAGIDFLYQTITVLRRQRSVTKLYLITFGFSLFIPVLLVNFTGLPGAVIGYLIIMCILFVLLVWEYFRIRIDLANKTRAEAEAAAAVVEAATSGPLPLRLRPSAARAERQRRSEVHQKWGPHAREDRDRHED